MPNLPKSSKTFLGTSQARYEVEQMKNNIDGKGTFAYFGIANGLQRCVNEKLHKNGIIEIRIHADEAPVTKSGTEHLWILAGKVPFDPDIYKPFEIAIYDSEGKPKTAEIFLRRFIRELNILQQDGIYIGGKHLGVTLKCIVVDTPAWAFLKNTVGHTAIFACERCSVTGEKVEGTTVYPSTNAEERTDDSFRGFQQPEHHHGTSAFLRVVPFLNMVAIFVLDLCIFVVKE
ncbi:uncharacterized protein LOC117169737 [Belonocnema kinseyi]|uniref:uncharacterized protein LOC117169737 n=1 Tax=Belonocnema kinseyi TaxID=2817044 RepID=UPI00143DC3BD|nr:uncharacterized protein LOC117169737 [Belonocnema kinseyi]